MRFAWLFLPLLSLLAACGLVKEKVSAYEARFPDQGVLAEANALFAFPDPFAPQKGTFALRLRVEGSFSGGFLALVPSLGEECFPDSLGDAYGLLCPGGEAPPGTVLLYLSGEAKEVDLTPLLPDLQGGFYPALWIPAGARFGGTLRLEFWERGTAF